MELTERKIKNIPFVSLGVLLMHQQGIDLKKKMHLNTYYKHRSILLAHGYDITQKTPKSRKSPYLDGKGPKK